MGDLAATTPPMRLLEIPVGSLTGFKALTPDQARLVSIESSATSLPSDWRAVYPQLSFEMALNYLPNQFDRGYKIAQIVSLCSTRPINLLVYADPLFTIASLDSKTKADRVRAAYSRSGFGNLDASLPLMDSLGQVNQALCVLDADDFELVIPHCMFSPKHFDATVLFTFHENAKIPGAVGAVEGFEHLARWQLEDLRSLSEHLKGRIECHECSELLTRIRGAQMDVFVGSD